MLANPNISRDCAVVRRLTHAVCSGQIYNKQLAYPAGADRRTTQGGSRSGAKTSRLTVCVSPI